ncbi:glycine--tRNA ligase subunit beta, partial [bacterium]|nr:glycine--tRNA ligase subunit beta [bacterium]
EKKGPALTLAFDENGALTKQGAGFFRSTGAEISSKEEMEKNAAFEVRDGRIVFLSKKEKVFTGALLQEHLPGIVAKVRFPKKMKWTTDGFTYARPVRSVLVLFGKQLIDVEICGVRSSHVIPLNLQQLGGEVSIAKPGEYLSKLEKGKVLALPTAREESIKGQLEKICAKHKTLVLHLDAVMKEVLFLTENPILAVGSFEERFLTLPEELIISEMVDHQKYFPMRGEDGKISTKFVVVVDKEPTEMMMANYENVLTARLSDGLFLYEKDLGASFDRWNALLEEVVHHPKLGSVYNKVERVVTLSDKLSNLLGMPYEKNAAKYCKADLVSDVVYEFPELQGTMGKYYAVQFGETDQVALAIEEHYMPRSEGAEIPTTASGTIVALADRLDNLLSYMGIGLIPTSSKDPYALRRAAVGVNRILIENKISLNLKEVVQDIKIADFIIQRMGSMLKEYGFSARDIEMCGIYDSFDPYKIYKCVEAIAHIRGSSDEFSRLVEIHKRIKGSVGSGEEEFSEGRLQEPAEKALSLLVKKLRGSYQKQIEQGEFEAAFGSLSEMVQPLENFFETVRVNVEDKSLQKNRQALLSIPYNLMINSLNF